MDVLNYTPVPQYAALLESEVAPESPKNSSAALPATPSSRLSFDSVFGNVKQQPPSEHEAAAAQSSKHTRKASSSIAQAFSASLSNVLVSSVANIPNTTPNGPSPRGPPNALLSTRDSLALQLTTTNFRRFVSRVGFIFWLQDRIEEILMWRKGMRYTCSWMGAYAVICYQPRLILIIPHILLLSVMMLSYHAPSADLPTVHTSIADPSLSASSQLPMPQPASEGSTAWLGNIQAIQNLMGFVSDAYDTVLPIVPHLTWKSRVSTPLYLFLLFTSLPMLFLPLRLTLLIGGLIPFLLTHPKIRRSLFEPDGQVRQSNVIPLLSEQFRQLVNDANLAERHIDKDLHEIDLYQNERWAWPSSTASSASNASVSAAGWKNASANLKPGERRAWTRGKDGSIAVGDVSTNLAVTLEPGWTYVETEDWEPEFLGLWSPVGADRDGWVYTNDAWLDPHPAPLEEWQKTGMTRRRRWTRRIYPAIV